MKKTFLVITMLVLTTSSFAVTLFCGSGLNQKNQHNLFVETIEEGSNSSNEVNCKILDVKEGQFKTDQEVYMVLKGKGIGIKFTGAEGFMINCPLVFNVDKLTKNSFYGVKVSAGALVGTSFGIFANKRLGTCVLNSISGLTIGASLSGAKLNFTQW